MDIDDCIIVGAGPAGLTAAIYLARYHLSIRMFDCGTSRAGWIPRTRNHAGFPDGINGEDGTELARDIDPLGMNKVAILVSRQCDAHPPPFFELVAQCPRQIEHDSLFSIALTRRPGIMSSVAGIYHN